MEGLLKLLQIALSPEAQARQLADEDESYEPDDAHDE
jgi:hypothetical protein